MNPKQKKNKEYQFPTNSMMVDEILKIIIKMIEANPIQPLELCDTYQETRSQHKS